jgi:hypothetical protein
VTTLADAFVRLRPNTKDLGPELKREVGPKAEEAGKDAGHKFGTAMVGAIKKAAAVLAVGGLLAVKGFLIPAIKQASDLNETASKTQVVFGAATDQVMKFADAAALKMGQSKQAVLDGASTFAIYGKTAGIAGKNLAGFSTDLVQLAGDMASFSNTSPEDAIQAIGAAMRGESDPIEKYGVLLNEAILKQVAFKNHITKTTTQALTPQQRVLAVQAALFEQLGAKGSGTMGDFQRTSAGLANQQRILEANWRNLSATVGTALLPIVTQLVTTMNTKLMPVLNDLWAKHGQQIIAWLQSMAANVGPGIGKLVDKVSSVDWPGVLDRAQAAIAKMSPELAKIGGGVGQGFNNTMHVGGVVMKFAADHADTLAKIMPVLVAGFVLVKTAQSLETVVAAARIPLSVLEMVSRHRTNLAIRAHTAALLANTAAQRAATGAEIASTAATNTGIIAKGRAVIANVAMRVSEIAKAVATGIATVAQIALDIAMAPVTIIILLIVAAVALLVLGILYLWRHNEGFRNFVLGAWSAIKKAFEVTVSWITDVAVPFVVKWFKIWWEGVKLTWDFVSTWFGKILDFLQSIPGRISAGAKGMWNGIVDAAKGAVNKVISIWNGLDIGINIGIPDWVPAPFGGKRFVVPDLFPDLPLLASGGVVKARAGGTAAVLGEAGEDEFAVPRSQMRAMIAEAVAAGGGGEIHLHFDGSDALAGLMSLVKVTVVRTQRETAAAIAGGVRA